MSHVNPTLAFSDKKKTTTGDYVVTIEHYMRYPLPDIEDFAQGLQGKTIFSVIAPQDL